MARPPDRRSGGLEYFLRFSLIALLLVSGTLLLVLVVLPRRYVLSAGFREAGLNYPQAGVPFTPLPPIRIAATPGSPTVSDDPAPRGPAEIFWDAVLPLLEAGRHGEAIPLFDDYLEAHPDDRDVRRERLATLIAAGRAAEAVPGLRALVEETGDRAVRLWLARTLRDLGRWDAAAEEYMLLAAETPGDIALALEWARALAWPERYAEAEGVLLGALDFHPDAPELRAELARVYYYMGRLEDAAALLATLDDDELAATDTLQLRADVQAALTPPEPEEEVVVEPTLLEQAIAARERDELDAAQALFDAALAERPGSAAAWLAYANFLEYERADFVGALEALRRVERLGGATHRTRFRMAELEAWTGDAPSALARLRALLDDVADHPDPDDPVTDAEVLALLGDLQRWEGDRVRAARAYAEALESDPENLRARDGVAAVEIEVALRIDEVEAPRMGSHLLGLGDTDDYGRVDVGGEWIGVRGSWAWSVAAGRRWLDGLVANGPAEGLDGTFVDGTVARWWRLGTVRTSARLGSQWLRDGAADPSVGLGLQLRPVSGGRLSLDYVREPAFGLTATLQSARADVTQERLLLSVDRPITERWTVSGQADLARLRTETLPGATPSNRVQGALTASRAVSRSWSLGWTASALTYTEAAPAPDGLRLYWDPNAAWATGPVARFDGYLSDRWEATLRVVPGLALIDERTATGYEAVPNLSGELGLEYTGSELRAAIDLFYAQSRLEGYRTYGARVSVSTGSFLSQGPGG